LTYYLLIIKVKTKQNKIKDKNKNKNKKQIIPLKNKIFPFLFFLNFPSFSNSNLMKN
jgi:hypothetical protein